MRGPRKPSCFLSLSYLDLLTASEWEIDRIWGICGSYYTIPKTIFYLLKSDYKPYTRFSFRLRFKAVEFAVQGLGFTLDLQAFPFWEAKYWGPKPQTLNTPNPKPLKTPKPKNPSKRSKEVHRNLSGLVSAGHSPPPRYCCGKHIPFG